MRFFNFILAVLYISIISFESIASELAQPIPEAAPSTAKAKLPFCVSDPNEISKIQSMIKANSKTENKYLGYRRALQSDSDLELFARLVYSETLAANCPENNSKISKLIAESIGNRIQKRSHAKLSQNESPTKSVVFQRDQFASSLNVYSESKFQEFLCPKDERLWSDVFEYVQKTLAGKISNSLLNPDSVNYFLYKHSARWTKEPKDWSALKEDPKSSADKDQNLRSCIRFFENPGWK
jgi:hypothetical protein